MTNDIVQACRDVAEALGGSLEEWPDGKMPAVRVRDKLWYFPGNIGDFALYALSEFLKRGWMENLTVEHYGLFGCFEERKGCPPTNVINADTLPEAIILSLREVVRERGKK